MNDVCRARPSRPSNSNVASLVKIWRSGQNRMRVPVRSLATRPPLRVSPLRASNAALGPSPSNTPAAPRWKLRPWAEGERSTSMSIRADSALTTESPTPCRPPVATYEPPPNLPPACSLVATTSTPGQPGLGLLVGRDAAPVVVHLGGAVGVQRDLDPLGRAGQRLVDAVVDDLPQAVHEATGVGGADVHARALAHGLQALEDQEVRGVVGVVGDRVLLRGGSGPGITSGWCSAPNLPATRRAPMQARLSLAGHDEDTIDSSPRDIYQGGLRRYDTCARVHSPPQAPAAPETTPQRDRVGPFRRRFDTTRCRSVERPDPDDQP